MTTKPAILILLPLMVCLGPLTGRAQQRERARLVKPDKPAAETQPVTESDPAIEAAADVPDPPAAEAQSTVLVTPEPAIEETIEITEVLLDALVTDRQGNVILGLEPGDFLVEEEGSPVEITSLSFYSNRVNLDRPDEAEAGLTPSPRYFLFFFHDKTRDDPGQRPRLRQAIKDTQKWIRTQMVAGDIAAVASYDFKLKIHQDFTTDRAALEEALGRAEKGKDPGANWPSRTAQRPRSDRDLPSLLAALPRGNDLRKETTRFSEAMRALGRATSGIQARKTLVLFSQGFEGNDPRGLWRPDPRYYYGMMQALNDSNVAVYAMDLARSGTEHSLRDSLSLLSNDTGGRFYDNLLTFSNQLNRVADENSGYYLLSYRSENPQGESGYRRVKVSIRNRELKLRVRGRQGFLYGES